MKAPRNVEDLAARLSDAASKPVPLPVAAPPPPAAVEAPAPPAPPGPRQAHQEKPPKAAAKPKVETIGITLRPSQALLQRYTLAAAERTKREGRVISAQQVMLEHLERGP